MEQWALAAPNAAPKLKWNNYVVQNNTATKLHTFFSFSFYICGWQKCPTITVSCLLLHLTVYTAYTVHNEQDIIRDLVVMPCAGAKVQITWLRRVSAVAPPAARSRRIATAKIWVAARPTMFYVQSFHWQQPPPPRSKSRGFSVSVKIVAGFLWRTRLWYKKLDSEAGSTSVNNTKYQINDINLLYIWITGAGAHCGIVKLRFITSKNIYLSYRKFNCNTVGCIKVARKWRIPDSIFWISSTCCYTHKQSMA